MFLMIKVTCIAIDFDDTLVSLEKQKGELFRICAEYKVPESVALKAYEEIYSAEGFSYQGMRKTLKKHGYDVSEKFEADLFEILKKNLSLFPETTVTLDKWKKMLPIIIITGGNEAFQKKKIEMVGLENYPCIVTKVGDKTEAIQKVLKEYGMPIAFIDNKMSELETLEKAGVSKRDVLMILLNRDETIKNSPYEMISSLEDPKLENILGI